MVDDSSTLEEAGNARSFVGCGHKDEKAELLVGSHPKPCLSEGDCTLKSLESSL